MGAHAHVGDGHVATVGKGGGRGGRDDEVDDVDDCLESRDLDVDDAGAWHRRWRNAKRHSSPRAVAVAVGRRGRGKGRDMSGLGWTGPGDARA